MFNKRDVDYCNRSAGPHVQLTCSEEMMCIGTCKSHLWRLDLLWSAAPPPSLCIREAGAQADRGAWVHPEHPKQANML